MREIKFRAWDKENKKMIQSVWVNQHAVGVDSACKEIWIDEIVVPMQYIGLKDKNGKEIYEGDILNTNNQFHEQVIYREGRWWTSLDGKTFRIMVTDWEEIEIIGNIYENPELL